MKDLMKLFRYLKAKEWMFFLFSLVFVCTQVVLDLKIPDYMSQITTLIETPGSAIGDVWSAGGMMLLCALGASFPPSLSAFLHPASRRHFRADCERKCSTRYRALRLRR